MICLAISPTEVWEQVETDLKYEGYVKRQENSIARAERAESTAIPDLLDYEGFEACGLRPVRNSPRFSQLPWGRPVESAASRQQILRC